MASVDHHFVDCAASAAVAPWFFVLAAVSVIVSVVILEVHCNAVISTSIDVKWPE